VLNERVVTAVVLCRVKKVKSPACVEIVDLYVFLPVLYLFLYQRPKLLGSC